MRGNKIARVAKGIAIAAVVVSVAGFVVSRLWNWLMPELFGLHSISFLQALGLLFLSKILFGGFKPGGGRGPGRMWRHQMKERWEGMSEEEREKFRAAMSERRGWCKPRSAEPIG